MPRTTYTTKERGSFLLRPGEYTVFLSEYQFGISNGAKTRGADTMSLKFETQEGQWIFDTIIFHPSTEWKASAFLRCFGVFFQEGSEVDINEGLLNRLVGRTAGLIKIKNEEYQGKMHNRLEAYIAAPDQSRPGAAQQRAQSAAVRTMPQAVARPEAAQDDLAFPVAAIPEDDIPF